METHSRVDLFPKRYELPKPLPQPHLTLMDVSKEFDCSDDVNIFDIAKHQRLELPQEFTSKWPSVAQIMSALENYGSHAMSETKPLDSKTKSITKLDKKTALTTELHRETECTLKYLHEQQVHFLGDKSSRHY